MERVRVGGTEGLAPWCQQAGPHWGKWFSETESSLQTCRSQRSSAGPRNIPHGSMTSQSRRLAQSRRLQETDVCTWQAWTKPASETAHSSSRWCTWCSWTRDISHYKYVCGNILEFFEDRAGGVRLLSTSTAHVFLSLNDVLCESILICVCWGPDVDRTTLLFGSPLLFRGPLSWGFGLNASHSSLYHQHKPNFLDADPQYNWSVWVVFFLPQRLESSFWMDYQMNIWFKKKCWCQPAGFFL